MTILFVDCACELGGAQRSLLELATALHARALRVQAAVPAGALADALRASGIAVHPIPAVRLHRRLHLQLVTDLIRFACARSALLRVIRTVRPEIIHANGITPALLSATIRTPCPVLWHVRDLHMPAAMVRHLARQADSLVAISDAVAAYLIQTVPARQRRKVHLVRNGIDTTHFRPGNRTAARQTFLLPADAPLVGMVAHLVPWKQHRAFLEMAAILHRARTDVHFVMAGRDLFQDHPQLRLRLEAQIAAAGLSGNITWVRKLDDIAPLLPALDVLVHPATDEPFGRVLCEAMAAGIPVVAVRSSGPEHIVPDGEAGHLVAPGDAAALARQTLRLLDSPEDTRRMGAAARRHVVKHFDVSRTAAEMHALYDAIQDT